MTPVTPRANLQLLETPYKYIEMYHADFAYLSIY